MFFVGFSYSQNTDTENYIQTRTYLEPVTTSSNTAKQLQTVQYFDGLGRAKQIVNVKASPQGKDVITHIEYDVFGRQVKDFLPVPQTNTKNGAISTDPLSNATDTEIYGTEKIYAEKTIENSPLNRIQQQIKVGNAWSDKPVKFDYDSNIDGEVIKFKIITTWVNNATKSGIENVGTYGVAKLYKTILTDEDGNKTIEFKNFEGQILLVRKVLSTTKNADTYYVYNEYGQLVFVVPPLASVTALDEDTLNSLCYQYRYDVKGRLVEKRLPGKDWEYMVYDSADRLVATQDANQKLFNKWLFTKYDKFGRVLYTGISIDNGDRNAVQTWITNTYGINVETAGSYTQSGLQIYYSNSAYPQNIESILSVNYYDSYLTGDPFPTMVYDQTVLPSNVQQYGVSTKGLLVSNFVKNIEDNGWTKTYHYYDLKGRPIRKYSLNHLGGYTNIEKKLDFSGNPAIILTQHKRLSTDTERVITETFTYDHQNRLLTHTHKVDANAVEYLAQNEYNELSQLKTKKLGGTSAGYGLQTVDYKYNIRGWLIGINNPNDLSGGDFFGYAIKYDNPVYNGIASGRFNGNIAEVDWNTSVGNSLKRYTYSYDGLNRLTDAIYTDPEETNPYSNNFNEHVTYDLNGNIKTLKRFAFPGVGVPTALKVDDLDYHYSGNRLTQIIENALNDTGYEGGNNVIPYDSNGNMISMWDKGIQVISYNHLNLPNMMSIMQPYSNLGSYNLNYLYRADGTKIRKYFSSIPQRGGSTTIKITDYLDGFHYNQTELVSPPCFGCPIEFAYERNAYTKKDPIFPGPLDPKPNTPGFSLDFVVTAEGFYSYTENRYIYQYKDHLGNARVSFARKIDGSLEITDTNDYYPFGLNHIGTEYKGFLGSYYNYKYNGKELQETGMYDYGARFYIPDIGRWGVMDPLAELALGWTPYRYAYDNPIRYIDPKGLFESRQEARLYRREHDIDGQIKRQKDGSYAINDRTNMISYTKGDDSNYTSSDMHLNDGVIESVIVKEAPYGLKDMFDLTTTDVSLFENVAWQGMSTAQKSKFVWDAKKIVKTTTGLTIPGSNSSWYRTKIPKAMKGIGVAGGAVTGAVLVYDVVDNKQIRASHVLDATITAVSFVPGWGWVVGGVFFGADMITKGVTGQSIGDHLNNYVEEKLDKDDGALIDWSK